MNNFQQTFHRQTRPVRKGPPRAARAAAAVFSKLAQATRYADPGLTENWPSIAGAEIAALGRPGRLLGAGRGRTLEIIVRDGTAAAEMQMCADDLLTAVNRYLGPGAVARIALRQRSGAPVAARPNSPEGKKEVNDSEGPLGAALSSFRAAIRTRSRDE